MIEHLHFSVRFPPNDRYPLGQAFDRTLAFETGMTAIVGLNETGKTLNLEMVEFLLFGASALRGAATDYKHLKGDGIFRIRGVAYAISRTHKNAALTDHKTGEVLVVGTKPVNARILKILGYGLDVFRVANVAGQGDAERLSEMKPTERKAMVDKLIGADRIEAIGTWCGDQALGVTREIAGLETGLVEPVEPVAPDGYEPGPAIGQCVVELRAARDRIVELNAFLANQPSLLDPGEKPTEIPLATLEKGDQILGLRTYDFDVEAVTEQALLHAQWKERQAFVARAFPQPTLDQDTVNEQRRRLDIEEQLVRLRARPSVQCECGKTFSIAQSEIEKLNAELVAIPVLEGLYDLDIEAQALRTWAKPSVQAEWQRLAAVPETAEPEHDPREAKGALHISEVVEALRVLGLSMLPREEIRRLAALLRVWEARDEAAREAAERHAIWAARAASARTELAAIDVSGLEAAEQLFTAAQVYEAQLVSYEANKTTYQARADRVAELRAEQTSWRNGRTAMNELRADTKSYLTPALSRVASYMLSQMTGGARARITVDEDFEIEVDGQPISTLSGSGKVCANLALRLGLGRVLTHGVFPVFMGDEMDASMDAERAGHLQSALTALEGQLKQIIIVTHKRPACQRVISLEI